MKRSTKITKAPESDEDRRKILQFKKKKQRQKEHSINYKHVRSLTDLDDYE